MKAISNQIPTTLNRKVQMVTKIVGVSQDGYMAVWVFFAGGRRSIRYLFSGRQYEKITVLKVFRAKLWRHDETHGKITVDRTLKTTPPIQYDSLSKQK